MTKAKEGVGEAIDPRRGKPVTRGAKARPAGHGTVMKRVVSTQVQNELLVSNRHEKIIAAAIKVFHEQGYHTTTTADIAHEAGLSQSNLYNYIRSKHDVLFLVCEHLVSVYDRLIEEVVESKSDPYERIVGALRAILGAMSDYREEVQLLYHETHALEKEDRRTILNLISQFIGQFQRLIRDYEANGGTTAIKDRRLAANMMSFIPAIVALRAWDLAQNKAKFEGDEIVNFILRGLGVPTQ